MSSGRAGLGGPSFTRTFTFPMSRSASAATAAADAAIVDSIGLEFYKELQPGRFNKLKVLKQSDNFPPAVIAYRQGGVDEPTLARVRDGLSSSHKTEMGREMMKMWKITSFEPVPASFGQTLSECLKAYPMPEAK